MRSKNSKANEAVIAYVPALHAGYLAFFRTHAAAHVYVLGKSLIARTPRMERDIRALSPLEAKQALEALHLSLSVHVLERKDLPALRSAYSRFVLPDEDISRSIGKLLKGKKVAYENVFLRWDKPISTAEFIIPPDRTVSRKKADVLLLNKAAQEATKSPDWWRQIGALILKKGKILFASHNRHLPSSREAAIMGDPRSNFDYGEHPEIYLSIHAEADAVAQAARAGTSLKGTDAYVTTFPCPNCARLLVRAGVKRIFYAKGYSSFDAEKILRSAGVEIILVQ